MKGVLAAAVAAALSACTGGGAPAPDLVSLAEIAPGVSVDMRYAGSENFVGVPIDGYDAPVCLLARPAALALAAVQHDLETDGLGLRVFDCYRPARAVAHFARWARDLGDERTKAAYYPRIEKSRLFELGYIAERSGHSRASTVDLTLVERAGDGSLRELDMGGPFDLFDPLSNTDSPDVTPEQRANRLRLRAAMVRRGFKNLPVEWWHYTLAAEPYPDTYLDLPVTE
jgi:D-alanyl-D-alanine dipeptidase